MKKGKLMEKIQRLFNIDVREVSLVDRPAVDESFIEVKRKDDPEKKKEEKAMDEKQLKEAIHAALAPLADGLKAIETRLETQEKAAEESKKTVDSLVTQSGEGAKVATDTLKGINEKLDEVMGDTVKRFERIEELVTKAKTQKIVGQEGEEGKKKEAKWPSLSQKQ